MEHPLHLDEFLFGAFIYLAAAAVAVPVASRLGLGSVLGYLAAGVAIGPAALGLIGREGTTVMHFAEFGVVVMLFIVGLELQPSRLWTLRRSILGLGGMQVLASAALIGLPAYFFAGDTRLALATGLILTMSSTAIVLQTLTEKGLLKTGPGQAIFSVLLFQDIAVIPILALLPLLAVTAPGTESHSLLANLPGWQQALATLAAIAAVIAFGRYLTRPFLRVVAQTRLHELFTASALLIVIGITLLMIMVGLSPALGAFLAGVVLAESEFRHELEADLGPFKGLLLGVFFISVGAGINFNVVTENPLTLSGLVAGFMLAKFAVLLALAKLFRFSRTDQYLIALALAQGGEFAFVLITFAGGIGMLPGASAPLLTAAVAISMALAPVLFLLHERIIAPRLSSTTDGEPDVIDETGHPVIIAGFGRFGMTIGRVLLAHGFRVTVLDHDAGQIETLRRFGYKVFYGDASRPDLLEAAGAREARLIIIAIDDRAKTLEIIESAAKHFPQTEVFARAFDRRHAYEVIEAGTTRVYREVFGSSLDLAEDALAALGIHPYAAHRAVRNFRHRDEAALRTQAARRTSGQTAVNAARASREEVDRVLAADRAAIKQDVDHAWDPPEGG